MKVPGLFAIVAIAAILLGAASVAQGPKVYRIGMLSPGGFAPNSTPGALADGIARRLAGSGYIMGTTLELVKRGADTHIERLPALARELVAMPVDVIVTTSYPAAMAAKAATKAIPVVIVNSGDPVKIGLVSSFSLPGGNVTGISDVAAELAPKRLEFLKEAAPGLKRVAMIWNASDLGMTMRYEASAAAAKALGVTVQSLGVREPDDFEGAFAAMAREPPDGILMVADILTNLNRKRVYDFAAAHRLPAIYESENFVHDGGLMSYGPDPGETTERTAILVERILKGASPANLPLEQPTRFRLVVNLKTAKALGLALPSSLLTRADEVIE
jgi:putative ABC transport system substrate-binding protein